METTKHRHAPIRTVERPFAGAVHPAVRENPRAHGWVTATEVCACGAERRVNFNFGHYEEGYWTAGDPEQPRAD